MANSLFLVAGPPLSGTSLWLPLAGTTQDVYGEVPFGDPVRGSLTGIPPGAFPDPPIEWAVPGPALPAMPPPISVPAPVAADRLTGIPPVTRAPWSRWTRVRAVALVRGWATGLRDSLAEVLADEAA